MSESILASGALKPVPDIFFGLGTIIMFAELLIAIKRALSSNFTTMRVVTIVVYGFLFTVCLDWAAIFNFFKDTIAPLIWNMLVNGRTS